MERVMREFPLSYGSSIIAVIGLPYTKREDIGRDIARWAKCPVLELDAILESLSTTSRYNVDSAAFNIMCETARTQLSVHRGGAKQYNFVVLSFPLSHKFQLRQLTELAWVNVWSRRRLLIIECKRKNEFQWQRDVERGIPMHHRIPGFELVKNWRDFDKAIRGHQDKGFDDYFVMLASEIPRRRVTKLVVYTDTDLGSRQFKEFIDPDRAPQISDAIEHFLTCDDDVEDGHTRQSVVEYAEWRRQKLERGKLGASRVTAQHYLCEPGDCVLRFVEKLEPEANCDACEQRVVERAYYCQICSLTLHESCADISRLSWVIEPYAMRRIDLFPETHPCDSCLRRGKKLSYRHRCNACVFRTHLKCRLMPTVLRHNCDKNHILSICLSWDFSTVSPFYCNACGLLGFWNSYCCNICMTQYHLECLDLPLEMKSEHGGHLHSMKLEFSCVKEEEYEWCLSCYKDIDPKTWVYTCQECDYVAHVYCIFSSIFEEYGHSDRQLL